MVFIDILEEYPNLVKAQVSQSLSQSQSSTSSTKSWLSVQVPKPKSMIKKIFKKLTARYKRQKTDEIYRQILVAADKLGVTPTELICYLGFRANYLANKKVANAFKSLGEGQSIAEMGLDKALYMKIRYNFVN